MQTSERFLQNYLHISKKNCTFASQNAKHTIMVTTQPTSERSFGNRMQEPMLGNYSDEIYYTRDEFMNELAKQLGQAYGLNDIREAR